MSNPLSLAIGLYFAPPSILAAEKRTPSSRQHNKLTKSIQECIKYMNIRPSLHPSAQPGESEIGGGKGEGKVL